MITRQDFIGPLRPVTIGDKIIKYKNSVTSLGVTIDNHLKWDQQIKKVAKSYRAKMSQFRRMTYLPISIQEEIYFKTVIAAVTYGIAVWGTCSQTLISQLEKIHARAAKLIHKLPRNISDDEALLRANWDRLDYLYKRRILAIINKAVMRYVPKISDNFLTKTVVAMRGKTHSLSLELQRKNREDYQQYIVERIFGIGYQKI